MAPEEIISDWDSQFTSKFWKSVCQSLNIDLKLSSPYHHQSNSHTERVNSVLEQYLRYFSNYKGSDWKNYLSFAEFSYNNAVQESSDFSPFFLNYGFHSKHSPLIPEQINVPRTVEFTKDFQYLIKRLKENFKMVLETQKTGQHV